MPRIRRQGERTRNGLPGGPVEGSKLAFVVYIDGEYDVSVHVPERNQIRRSGLALDVNIDADAEVCHRRGKCRARKSASLAGSGCFRGIHAILDQGLLDRHASVLHPESKVSRFESIRE